MGNRLAITEVDTCNTCRWWKAAGPFRDGPLGTGNVWFHELGRCLLPRLKQTPYPSRRPEDAPKSKPSDVIVSPEHAELQTGPDFGCVHHDFRDPDMKPAE